MQKRNENWLNTNTNAASLLALLQCCQALEVAGAAIIEQITKKMRAPLKSETKKLQPLGREGDTGCLTAMAGVTESTMLADTTSAKAQILETIPPSRVYLAPHTCHVAVIVDDLTCTDTRKGTERNIAVVRHFNLASSDVGIRLLEALLVPNREKENPKGKLKTKHST